MTRLQRLMCFAPVQVTRPQAERHDTGALYKKMSISQLQQLVPQVFFLHPPQGVVVDICKSTVYSQLKVKD